MKEVKDIASMGNWNEMKGIILVKVDKMYNILKNVLAAL